MADTVKKVEILIGAKDTSGNVFNSLERRLGGIKRQFGRRGLFGDLGEILTGGGVIGGITFLANTIRDAAKRAGELREQFATGAIDAQQMTAELVRQIPVLGQMIQMWDAIGEAIFTSNDELKRRDIEKQQTENEGFRKKIGEGNDRRRGRVLDKAGTIQDQIGTEMRTAGKEGDALQFEQNRIDLEKRFKEIGELEAGKGLLAPEQRLALEKQIAEMRQKAYAIAIAREDQIRAAGAKRYESEQENIKETERRMKQRRKEEQEAIQEAIEKRKQEKEALVGSLISGMEGKLSGLSAPAFSTLEESRFGTGKNDSARERIRAQWEQKIAEALTDIRKSAQEIADGIGDAIDLNDVGALLG